MIEGSKQQQLTFDKGITNVPSDAICSDNALEESLGMIYDDGEHRVIQKPVEFMTIEKGSLIFIHKFNNEERYIFRAKQGDSYVLCWRTKTDATPHVFTDRFLANRDIQVTAIGKTLIVLDNDGLHYYLWTKNDGGTNIYEPLGDTFPRPEVEYYLGDRNSNVVEVAQIDASHCLYEQDGNYNMIGDKQNDWNDVVVGLYSKAKKKIAQKRKFHSTFCVRAALELYDGTYYHVQNPVFMLNQFSPAGAAQISTSLCTVFMQQYGQELYYRFYQDYSKWSDIIKNVVLFVTKQADIFDTSVDCPLRKGSWGAADGSWSGSDRIFGYLSGNKLYWDSKTYSHIDSHGDMYNIMDANKYEDFENTIKEGVYYKLCEIGIRGNDEGDTTWHKSSDHFQNNTIENITTQPQLGADDYYSHCALHAGLVYAYNSRLNLADVSRGFFEGFDFFMPYDDAADLESDYEFRVTIKTNEGPITVSKTKRTKQKQGIYFYYPDPRAKHVVILKGGTQILNEDLKEHPALNGAYFYKPFTSDVTNTLVEPTSATGSIPSVSPITFEPMPSTIMTSEVNNPYVYPAEGYNDVGTGKIIALTTITQALSQGQFGQYPLLVFTTEGIWAMSVNATGLFSSAHPMSREVCNNVASITQTDGAVFFSSEKGLMVIVGSQVKCVSEQLLGKSNEPFAVFLKTAHIAYDYRDSLLWIANNSSEIAWIYAIKSGTFGRRYLPTVSNASASRARASSRAASTSSMPPRSELAGPYAFNGFADSVYESINAVATYGQNFRAWYTLAWVEWDNNWPVVGIIFTNNKNFYYCVDASSAEGYIYGNLYARKGWPGEANYRRGDGTDGVPLAKTLYTYNGVEYIWDGSDLVEYVEPEPTPDPDPDPEPTPDIESDDERYLRFIPYYPDCLMQTGNTVYSLLDRPNINLDENTDYVASIITRPMKLENAQALKSIMQIRHVKQMQGTVSLQIFASNNLNGNWVELHSLRGTPWLYYKFILSFSNMPATDSYAGMVVVTQERRINKLR